MKYKNCIRKRVGLYLIVSFAVIILSGSFSNAFAQGVRTSYFMDNVPFRLKMNPALQPTRGFFNIPAVGALGISASSNTISIENFIDIIENDNDFLTSEKFIRQLDNKNRIDLDVTTDILSFGFYSGKGFWTINVGARAIATTTIPRQMFEFARNSGELELGKVYDIRDMELHADIFGEVGIGYSRPVNERLTLGGRIKFLAGLGNMDAEINEMYINAGNTAWNVKTRGKLKASDKGLEVISEIKDTGKEYIIDVDHDKPRINISGYGASLDFGATYKIIPNLTLSAAILDVGFIKWSKSSTTIAVTDSEHSYSVSSQSADIGSSPDYTTQPSDVFDWDLMQFEEMEPESRSTTLRSTLNIGAEYTFLKGKLGIGLLSSTQFLLPEAYTELTLSGNYHPNNWLGTTLSYSFLHSEFKTLGIGLKLGPVFIGSDYLMTKAPKEVKRVNGYLGISIPLGRGRTNYWYD